ncbi:MAG: hypothetical protein JO273_07010 [Methylobacteriaceae bacterium]|nr:hypothetical protein [Methylobacteriaceae bacterium]
MNPPMPGLRLDLPPGVRVNLSKRFESCKANRIAHRRLAGQVNDAQSNMKISALGDDPPIAQASVSKTGKSRLTNCRALPHMHPKRFETRIACASPGSGIE